MSAPSLPPDASGARHIPLVESARRAAAARWVESRLFAITGAWAASVPLPSAQVHFAGQSARHARHAELWRARIPVLAWVDPDALTAAPSRPVEAVLDRLVVDVDGDGDGDAGGDGGPGTLPLLAGMSRVVLPRLIVSYQRHRSGCSAVADGPVIDTVDLALSETIADWRWCEGMVQELAVRPHDLAAVHHFVDELERLLVQVEGVAGLLEPARHGG